MRAMPFAADIIVIIAYFAVIMGIGLSQRSKSGSVEGVRFRESEMQFQLRVISSIEAPPECCNDAMDPFDDPR